MLSAVSAAKRLKARTIVIVVVLLLGAAWAFATLRSYSWSQEIRAEIAFDGRRFSGNSIGRVTWDKRWRFDPAGGSLGRRFLNRVDAEAAVIDIPGRKPVFVLLAHTYRDERRQETLLVTGNRPYIAAELAARTILPPLGAYKVRNDGDTVNGIVGSRGVTKPIPDNYRPALAMFDNPSDPRSLRVVTNDAELSGALGAPAQLTSVTLTIGDETPTDGRLRQYLPWLPDPAHASSQDSKGSDIMAAFAAAGGLAREVRLEHFLMHMCFGTAAPCPQK